MTNMRSSWVPFHSSSHFFANFLDCKMIDPFLQFVHVQNVRKKSVLLNNLTGDFTNRPRIARIFVPVLVGIKRREEKADGCDHVCRAFRKNKKPRARTRGFLF